MKNKKFIVSDKMQQVAVDFLEELYFCKTIDEVFKVLKEKEKKYNIMKDPFTYLPCTSKEYEKLSKSYYEQCFEEKWGYPPDFC